MNKLIIILSILFISVSALAQQDSIVYHRTHKKQEADPVKTLFGDEKGGGFIGFGFGYTPIGNSNGLMLNGSCGLIVGRHLTFGIIAKGFATDMGGEPLKNGTRNHNYSGGYGGFLVEPILFPKAPIHVSFPIVMGIGGVGYYWKEYDVAQEFWKDGYNYNNFFMVIEPGIEAEMNLTKHMRMSVGAAYRITTSSNISGLTNNSIDGLSTYLGFKFGIF